MNRLADYSSRFRILKGGKISLVVSALLAGSTMSFAAPSGGSVTSGNATINQNGAVTTINQSSNKASINWQNFSIGSNETVNFVQPNTSSITLNRVIGNEKSIINGALNANGQVWILNSNGVLFNSTARINTSGLVATTAQLSDADFQSGNYVFKNATSNSVINLGTIEVSNAGSVVLASNEVVNSGTIKALSGRVHLVGADSYTLNLNGNSLVNLTVNKGVLDALVKNSGTILADGGEIYLTTNAVNELLKGVVNNTGLIEANSLEGITGKVELFAHGGEVQVGGTISAKEGFVETSGKDFSVLKDAKIQAGEWLIDPVDITIDAALASTIETALGSGDVTITTDGFNTPDTTAGESGTTGDISVNSAITWNTAQKLTLSAANNIYINAPITATNAAGQLALYYGQGAVAFENTSMYDFGLTGTGFTGSINLQSGNNFFTKKGNDGSEITWKVITTLAELQAINDLSNPNNANNISGVQFVLGANIDASDTVNWNVGDHDNNAATPNVAMGFMPIAGMGIDSSFWGGDFDGLGHTIDNLYINRPQMINGVGLFRAVDGSTIRNVGLTNVNVTGGTTTGGLIGRVNGGHYDNDVVGNVYVKGEVHSSMSNTFGGTGGIVGYMGLSSMTNSYSTATVTGFENVGGLIGYVSMNGPQYINYSYATGDVSGVNKVGGLIGKSDYGRVNYSYATGDVTGVNDVGGFFGYDRNNGGSYYNYSIGHVTGSGSNVGGFAGNAMTVFQNNFYDKTINPGMWDESLAGKTTTQLQTYIAGDIFSIPYGGWTQSGGMIGDNTLDPGYLYPVLVTEKGVTTWRMIPSTGGGSGSGGSSSGGSGSGGSSSGGSSSGGSGSGGSSSGGSGSGGSSSGGSGTLAQIISPIVNDAAVKQPTYSNTQLPGVPSSQPKIYTDVTKNISISYVNGNLIVDKADDASAVNGFENIMKNKDFSFSYDLGKAANNAPMSGDWMQEAAKAIVDYLVNQGVLDNSNTKVTFSNGEFTITSNETSQSIKVPLAFSTKATSSLRLVSDSKEQTKTLKTAGQNDKTKVPLGGDSVVDIVNGGVHLPNGVNQLFFVSHNQ